MKAGILLLFRAILRAPLAALSAPEPEPSDLWTAGRVDRTLRLAPEGIEAVAP